MLFVMVNLYLYMQHTLDMLKYHYFACKQILVATYKQTSFA